MTIERPTPADQTEKPKASEKTAAAAARRATPAKKAGSTAAPVKKAASSAAAATKATPAKKGPVKKAAAPKAMRRTVRDDRPVASRLDADDRKDIRATNSDEDLRRNKAWDWHKLWLWLVRVAGIAAVYVVVLLVVRWAMPDASIKQGMVIAGTAVSLATGAVAVAQWLPRRQPKHQDKA